MEKIFIGDFRTVERKDGKGTANLVILTNKPRKSVLQMGSSRLEGEMRGTRLYSDDQFKLVKDAYKIGDEVSGDLKWGAEKKGVKGTDGSEITGIYTVENVE